MTQASSPKPAMSFIIPVRNDATRLAHCLRSIKSARSAGKVEMVVADNGSTDDSAAVAAREGAVVIVVPGVGLGALRNAAVAAAGGEVLAFVDADHEIGAEWIDAALETFANPKVGAVGDACRPPTPGTWVQRTYDRLRRHGAGQREVDWLGTGNMAVRRKAFEVAGGFDTSLETCEDVDLCRKLRGAGWTLVADARMHNIHFGDPRTLRQVFLGELWRGRDNVRVSFRAPRAWRTLVSALIPIVNLVAVATMIIGLIWQTPVALTVALVAARAVLGFVALRAGVMIASAPPREFPGAFAVAAAYELGRALALPARVGYGRRRREAAA